jgi:hypothetical protein
MNNPNKNQTQAAQQRTAQQREHFEALGLLELRAEIKILGKRHAWAELMLACDEHAKRHNKGQRMIEAAFGGREVA